jgi:hypothetical protein
MDDKDKDDKDNKDIDKGAADAGSGTTGSTRSTIGGAVAGAIAGTALGVPVVGTVIWSALRGCNWCGKEADSKSNTAQGEGRACIAKKEEFKGKKTIEEAQSEDGER